MNKNVALSRPGARRRTVAALVAALAAGTGAFAMIPAVAQAAALGHRAAASAGGYAFSTLNDQADLTFNQLLGINSSNVISGYFGSGTLPAHPNKGYLLDLPYQQSNYVNENFPGSVQTQVTGLNNKGDTVGFWVNGKNTNRGFVDWNGSFTSYTDPKTPKTNGAVNQLLGINDAGIAVGFYNDAKGHAHAYTLNQATGKFTGLQIPGKSVTATGINNAGNIVGFAGPTGSSFSWLRHNGQLTTLQFPGGSDTQAFGINDKQQIVGTYLDGGGVMHGFVVTDPLGPKTHWKSVDDPNGVGSTTVNGINDAGDLVGFYTDSAGNVDGMLAVPTTTSAHLSLMPMPEGTVTFGRDGSGDLTAKLATFGLTPGSAHAVVLANGSSIVAQFSTLTANGVGQASATLASTYTGSIPSGSRLVVRNGSTSASVDTEPIAQTATLSGSSSKPLALTAVEITPHGKSYGTPAGTASMSYNAAAKTLTVTVNATGLTPGMHAAHVHLGSCQNQGPVQYMLMDFVANSHGQISNESRTVTGVPTAIPVNGWYLNLHQGTSQTILKNGAPTIFFRPLLCANV